MYKKLLLIMFAVFFISSASAALEDIGTHIKDSPVELVQLCGDCSYNNITSVVLPNGTQLILNVEMNKGISTVEYTYNFNQTDLIGKYFVNGFGDPSGTVTGWAYTFKVTNVGEEFTTEKSLFYLGILGVLTLFFMLCVGGITILPSKNERDDDNKIVSINNLKHLKLVLVGAGWGILVMMSYIIYNVADAYLPSSLVADVFYLIFSLLMYSAMVGVPLIFIFIFVNFIQDQKFQKMIERGIM